MNNELKNIDIPVEKFAFVNEGEKIHDKKLETKPIGFFKDALIRFRKNKASVAAFIIIILIILFAVIVPIITPSSKAKLLDTNYKNLGPKVSMLKEKFGIFDGSESLETNERTLIAELSIGVAAEFDENKETISLKESMSSDYQPVIEYGYSKENTQGSSSTALYNIEKDAYLSVGFKYVQLEQQEYQRLINWQEKEGIKVVYPLIQNNEYCVNIKNPNFWYKTEGKGIPLIEKNGQLVPTTFSEDLVLIDNYRRDANGNYVYWEYVGGGNEGTASYNVRVLYYNYYIYKNGFEPNYILGTDAQGYDMAYRLSSGVRLSLVLALCVSVVNFIIGAMVGAIEGFYGGTLDLTLERFKDILGNVPFIIVSTLFQMHLARKVGVIPCLIFAFVLTGWIGISDRVRTQFYRFKNHEYVLAAKTLGAKNRRIIWKHIFPNTLGTLVTSTVLIIPSVIFSESMLSYLGIVNLGGSETTSLGALLSSADRLWTDHPHLLICPAVIISLLMICFNLFGNGLRDAFNPTLRGSEE